MKMTTATQNLKLFGLAFLLVGALAALGYRLVDLQVLRHDELQALAARNTVRTIAREPARGRQVRDRPVELRRVTFRCCRGGDGDEAGVVCLVAGQQHGHSPRLREISALRRYVAVHPLAPKIGTSHYLSA